MLYIFIFVMDSFTSPVRGNKLVVAKCHKGKTVEVVDDDDKHRLWQCNECLVFQFFSAAVHYEYFETPTKYYAARRACWSQHGNLAVLDNWTKISEVTDLFRGKSFWVGGNRFSPSNEWHWSNGNKINATLWDKDQPLKINFPQFS